MAQTISLLTSTSYTSSADALLAFALHPINGGNGTGTSVDWDETAQTGGDLLQNDILYSDIANLTTFQPNDPGGGGSVWLYGIADTGNGN